ncbi:MAG TPA: tripartite tricarboxylate transporter substrate binding protein [Burkholderiaceae bacterium]|nr:tripartite tricarboxylate transporter substrate binding protein [Burkholderiaceae bacterium]
MTTPLPRRLFTLLAATALATPFTAQAQAWPAAKPITLVVPFTAGGSVDFSARLVATKLGERLKQSVVVENVAGAGGAIGVSKVVQANPDGYTLVVGPDSPIVIGRLINPSAFRYDPLADLAPVGLISTAPMVLVARPGLPAKDFGEFVKLAKKEPGKYNYATSGIGTVLQLAMELLKDQTGTFVTHIPYRGGAQIASDVIGNQVDLAMLVATTAMPHISAGRVKALGVTGAKRLPNLPQVPAFAEMPGLKGYEMNTWIGLFAPGKTPPEVVARINQELNEVLKSDEIKAKFSEQGATAGNGSPAQFGTFVREEYARNQKIVQRANIKE